MNRPRPNPRPKPKTAPPSPAAWRRRIERDLHSPDAVKSTAVKRAQERFYDACEAGSAERATACLHAALELDPHNADALLMAADLAGLAGAEAAPIYRAIVEKAAARLGAEAFAEFHGEFWGFHETRPYMRARQQLAMALAAAGLHEEAAAEYAGMLELNPNDNQGVRYELLALWLRGARLESAQALLKKYPDDCDRNPVFAWGQVLHRFLRGQLAGAAKALVIARRQNPATEAYVTGRRALPRRMPGSYQLGSPEEAKCFARDLRAMWQAHPAALAWLGEPAA